MSGKKIDIGLKPGVRRGAEDWIQEREEKAPPPKLREVEQPDAPATKRLTIDIPADLHRTLKMKAAAEGVKMADLVRKWIEDHV